MTPTPAHLDPLAERPLAAANLDAVVEDVLARTPFVDVHTHLFPPALQGLLPLGHRRSADLSLPRSGAVPRLAGRARRPTGRCRRPRRPTWCGARCSSSARRSPKRRWGWSRLCTCWAWTRRRIAWPRCAISSAASAWPTTCPSLPDVGHQQRRDDQRSARRRGDGGVGSRARHGFALPCGAAPRSDRERMGRALRRARGAGLPGLGGCGRGHAGRAPAVPDAMVAALQPALHGRVAARHVRLPARRSADPPAGRRRAAGVPGSAAADRR